MNPLKPGFSGRSGTPLKRIPGEARMWKIIIIIGMELGVKGWASVCRAPTSLIRYRKFVCSSACPGSSNYTNSKCSQGKESGLRSVTPPPRFITVFQCLPAFWCLSGPFPGNLQGASAPSPKLVVTTWRRAGLRWVYLLWLQQEGDCSW